MKYASLEEDEIQDLDFPGRTFRILFHSSSRYSTVLRVSLTHVPSTIFGQTRILYLSSIYKSAVKRSFSAIYCPLHFLLNRGRGNELDNCLKPKAAPPLQMYILINNIRVVF